MLIARWMYLLTAVVNVWRSGLRDDCVMNGVGMIAEKNYHYLYWYLLIFTDIYWMWLLNAVGRPRNEYVKNNVRMNMWWIYRGNILLNFFCWLIMQNWRSPREDTFVWNKDAVKMFVSAMTYYWFILWRLRDGNFVIGTQRRSSGLQWRVRKTLFILLTLHWIYYWMWLLTALMKSARKVADLCKRDDCCWDDCC